MVAAGAEWVTLEELKSDEFRSKLPAELSNKLTRTVMATLAAYKSPPEQAVEMAAMVTAFRNEGKRWLGDIKPETLAKMFGPETTRYTFWVEIDKGFPMKWGALTTVADGSDQEMTAEWTEEITAIGTTDV